MTDTRRARYVALFATETRTLLASARRALAGWREQPEEAAPAEEVFRVLHTIKGMAASLEFNALAEHVHAAEGALAGVRSGERAADHWFLAALEETLDALAVESDAVVAAETTPRGAAAPAARIVRVDSDRLDALLAELGGLVTARQELERRAEADSLSPIGRAAIKLARRLDRLQDRILAVRLAPFGELLERVPPMIRDLARQLGKDVTVEVQGEGIEVDRAILDRLGEPLLHLLRNAVDHGLETPEARRAAGKAAAGRITVAARQDRNVVELEVRDDGHGIDREAVVAKAIERGALEAGAHLDDEDLLAILARPGFSTAAQVTDVSGRGVGLDAVLARMREVGATVSLATTPGAGTTFTIRMPTRLGIVRALVTRVGEEPYVLPLTHVTELAAWDAASSEVHQGRNMIRIRDALIPVVDLRRLVQFRGTAPPVRRPAVIMASQGRRMALLADAVEGQVDAVVQPLDRPQRLPRWITGATILEDGQPALMLDLASVI